MKKILYVLSAAGLLFAAVSFSACKPNIDPSDDSGTTNTTGNQGSDNGDSTNTGNSGNNGNNNPNNKKPTQTPVYVTKIDGGKVNGKGFAVIDLSAYAGKTVTAAVESKMYVINDGESAENLMWQINTGNLEYPMIAGNSFEPGTTEWTQVDGNNEGNSIDLSDEPYFYLNNFNITSENFTIYVKDFKLTITPEDEAPVTFTEENLTAANNAISKVDITSIGTWLSSSVPSLKETYADQFDSIGIAAEYGNFGLSCSGDKYTGTYTHSGWGKPNELYYEEVQKGIAKHANSITLGNEFKPQFILQWWDGKSNNTYVDFTASNGQTIKVPSKLNGEDLIYATLNVCKKMGVQMRGHVLTWHSQTPDGFFAENYTPTYNGDLISNMVSKEVMTARHEWYIKTVLKCVADWEAANNYKAIWAWDVVNEAMADDAGKTYTGTSQDWLRGSTTKTKNKKPDAYPQGSRWYQLYENEDFIINAFRFANAYAPEDVKLCYNDYNEYIDYSEGWKTSAIEHIVGLIKAGDAQTVNGKSVAPRIDVIAMQSHVSPSYPGVTAYENALKRFLALCDVHVSEIDFEASTQAEATLAWSDYFKMLQKYGKKSSGTHKVTNVTIWGVNNENSWINPASGDNKKTYPLLFNIIDNNTTTKKSVTYNTGAENLPCYDVGDSYKPNDAFWAVINAHQN